MPPCLPPPLRLGLNRVKGLSEDEGRKIAETVTSHGPFTSIEALWRASDVRATAMVKLAAADAFGSMGLDRQSALWHARKLRDQSAPLFSSPHSVASSLRRSVASAPELPLPKISRLRQVIQDYGTTGLTLREHPLAFLRDWLEGQGLTPACDLTDEKKCPQHCRVIVAGLCLVRQRPGSAKSITFMTIEDETGAANLVVYPDIFERDRAAARHSTALLAHGRIDRQGQIVHVVTSSFASLDGHLAELDSQSRNFR